MKKLLLPLSFLITLALLSGCQHQNDAIIAGVYEQKLYFSEVSKAIPQGLTPADSVQMAQRYITQWIEEQLVLHEAQKTLSLSMQDFNEEIQKYRKQLIINAYYEKLGKDSSLLQVNDAELMAFLKKYSVGLDSREIVRLNYVRIPLRLPQLSASIKAILFDKNRRISEKQYIERLCGDSIEHFIDDNTWLYWDEVKDEFDIGDIDDLHLKYAENRYIEKNSGQWRYLIVLLDYKMQAGSVDISQRQIGKKMLQQQKKNQLVQDKINELYEKAVEQKKIAR